MIFLFTVLISFYIALALSVILKLEKYNALEGRLLVALILPIVHFLILPVQIIRNKENIFEFSKVKAIITLFIIFPIVIEYFAIRCAEENNVVIFDDVEGYEVISGELIPKYI